MSLDKELSDILQNAPIRSDDARQRAVAAARDEHRRYLNTKPDRLSLTSRLRMAIVATAALALVAVTPPGQAAISWAGNAVGFDDVTVTEHQPGSRDCQEAPPGAAHCFSVSLPPGVDPADVPAATVVVKECQAMGPEEASKDPFCDQKRIDDLAHQQISRAK